ncbi:MAG: hypothetical protein ACYSWW_15030 [Planctomycetota bacterium]|nr:MAG: hypothetical protein CEE38_13380 [Planctomycetes bacterium B3_Pla]
MIFIKLVRVLAVVLAVWLIGHLLFSAGRKNAQARQQGSGDKHRKFVNSSVIEKQNQGQDEEDS